MINTYYCDKLSTLFLDILKLIRSTLLSVGVFEE
jgi:hypothetical protein